MSNHVFCDDLDDDMRAEIMSSFEDLYFEAESCLSQLKSSDERAKDHSSLPVIVADVLNELFRAVHSIKGNAAMVHLLAIVDYTHQLENIVSAMRAGIMPITDHLCEVILLGLDRLRDLHQRDVCGEQIESIGEIELARLFDRLSTCDQAHIKDCVQAIVNFARGDTGAEADTHNPLQPAAPIMGDQNSSHNLSAQQIADLHYFQTLSLLVDKQKRYWMGRSIQVFDWIMKMNRAGGGVVDYAQLAAAAYMHDMGMSLVGADILEKCAALSADEYGQIKQHCEWGSGLLVRMPGWQEAATIVLQHHEYPNGRGYPNGLTEFEIHDGAKIIAIVDAFFSMTNARADRQSRRSTMRAISEINARKNAQFSDFWVEIFNQMLKSEICSGHI